MLIFARQGSKEEIVLRRSLGFSTGEVLSQLKAEVHTLSLELVDDQTTRIKIVILPSDNFALRCQAYQDECRHWYDPVAVAVMADDLVGLRGDSHWKPCWVGQCQSILKTSALLKLPSSRNALNCKGQSWRAIVSRSMADCFDSIRRNHPMRQVKHHALP